MSGKCVIDTPQKFADHADKTNWHNITLSPRGRRFSRARRY